MTVQLVDYQPKVYQGQYGEFSITEGDRSEVIIYRLGLFLAGLSFTAGSVLILWKGATLPVLQVLTPLFGIFALALGISLLTIHIYLAPLHKLLQIFWLIGIISAIVLAGQSSQPLALYIYNYPLSILGMGFIFAALTGIYFKEAFCFNRLETKFLSVIVPSLLLGHLFGLLPVRGEQFLLSCWTLLFIVFVMRKAIQPIPPDIGDKSVFNYLKQQK
jgi:uncharacterized integral membrane protein